MSAGQIQKPSTVSKQNDAAEPKAPAVTQDLSESFDDEVVETSPKVAVKKPTSDKLDKVQKRAKGIKCSPLDVVATQDGFYANRRIKPGEKFKLDDESDFSHNWMKKI